MEDLDLIKEYCEELMDIVKAQEIRLAALTELLVVRDIIDEGELNTLEQYV